MAFTELQIKRLKPAAERYDVTETGVSPDRRGLQIRVYPSGAKTWLFRFSHNGKTERLKLGNYPDMTIQDAHKAQQEKRELLIKGQNPKRDIPRKQSKAKGLTVQGLYDDFRDNYLRIERKRPEQAEQALEANVLPVWRDLLAADIERFEIVELIRSINKRSPRTAEVVKALVSQMFKHGTDVGLIPASPAVGLPTIGSRGERRERLLTHAEIKTFWEKLDTAKMQSRLKTVYRLLLVTGQRRGEVAATEWAHIDLDKNVWTIPGELSKNGKPHQVPLTAMALDLLEKLDNETPYLLPSPSTQASMDAHSLTRAIRNNEKHFQIDHFTPHDLRRTVASHMTAMGVPRLHVSKLLNHSDQGVTAIYDRHDYMKEKREALELWADQLQKIIKGKARNIVPIREAV